MIWTAPGIEIHSLQLKAQPSADEAEFVVEGIGFREGITQVVFVRATIQADDGLKNFQVIPGKGLKVDPANDQRATFSVSLFQRESGAYHFVACNPPEQKVNQVDVLEWAIAIAALPGKPVHVEVNTPGT